MIFNPSWENIIFKAKFIKEKLRSREGHSFHEGHRICRLSSFFSWYILQKMKKRSEQWKAMPRMTEKEALAGLKEKLPQIETFPNQYPDYEIKIEIPEFTSVCPKTGLPDFGTIYIRYVPKKSCLELKSLKNYILAYRNLGIFYENAVNRVLEDVVKACHPVQASVTGEFNPRGGMKSVIEVRYPRPKTRPK
jgi:7-cyano-7-deazaguanine reductase